MLTPGPSRNARPRVAGPPQQQVARNLAAASRALSAGLAARRRSYGLTQPELAVLVDVSVTTIGHAETGRLWQSRDFWVHADAVLGAGGDLLRLHDAFGEASAASAASAADDPDAADAGSPGAAASAAEPAHPEIAGTAEPALRDGAHASGPGGAPLPQGQGTEPAACLAGVRSAAAPACVMIMWGDGTVTTVHPPEAPAPGGRPRGPRRAARAARAGRGAVRLTLPRAVRLRQGRRIPRTRAGPPADQAARGAPG